MASWWPVRCCIKSNQPGELSFSTATYEHLPALAAIEQASFSWPWTLEQFRQELAKPYSHTLIALLHTSDSPTVVGYAVFWVVADELHLLNLAVAPLYRRRGIGRALLNEVLSHGRNLGARIAWLEVRPSNTAALALYSSLGFRQVMVRKRYYVENGEDALILMLPLTRQPDAKQYRPG